MKQSPWTTTLSALAAVLWVVGGFPAAAADAPAAVTAGGGARSPARPPNVVVIISDDQGYADVSFNPADNAPLRGFKGQHYEGGMRTPFIVSWPARFAGGRSIDTPVIALDVLPTVLEAVGAAPPAGAPPFDGKSLLPLLTGRSTAHHEALYWSGGGTTGDWVVRQGNWKLHAIEDKVELTDLAADPDEATDLAAKHPDRVRAMTALYDAWIEQMADPLSGGGKRWDPAAEPKPKRPKKAKAAPAGDASPAPPPAAFPAPATKPAQADLTPREQVREIRRVERKQERGAAKSGTNPYAQPATHSAVTEAPAAGR